MRGVTGEWEVDGQRPEDILRQSNVKVSIWKAQGIAFENDITLV
jgi:hypothetical protein